MDCMHRFCGECIVTCLRLSNKECPTCRTKCGSKVGKRVGVARCVGSRAVYLSEIFAATLPLMSLSRPCIPTWKNWSARKRVQWMR